MTNTIFCLPVYTCTQTQILCLITNISEAEVLSNHGEEVAGSQPHEVVQPKFYCVRSELWQILGNMR
ncbi:hypothetical protein J6590_009826 [Homalodisca vitripennis]|nr:hypothetical protein J6590_009826 [Homalodisca vitripennis]